MPVKETLTAVLQARESITNALGDVESGALDAAAAFEAAQAAADSLEGGLDAVERGAGAVARELDDVTSSAASAAAGLSLADERADEAGDSFIGTATEAGVLAGALSSLPAAGALGGTVGFAAGDVDAPTITPETQSAIADVGANTPVVTPEVGDATTQVRAELDSASFAAVHAAIDAIPTSRTLSVEADLDTAELAAAQSAMTAIPDGGVVDVGLDAPGRVPQPALPSMPDVSALSFGAEVAADVEGGDELAGLGAAGHIAAEGLDAAGSAAVEASAASALAASQADEAGDDMAGSAADAGFFASSLGGVRDAAFAAVPGLTAAGAATDEYGDEASEAAVETMSLAGAQRILSNVPLAQSIKHVGGRIAAMTAIVAAATPAILGLVGPLGAVATAGVGAGGALATLFGAGLLARGEELVGTLQMVDGELTRIENAGQGVEVILGNIKDRAAEMLSVLQTPTTADFVTGIIEGGLDVFEDWVGLVSRISEPLFAMADRLGNVFAIEEPRFFAEMEATIISLLPYIEAFLAWALGAMPDALNWMRTEGLSTIDMFARLGGAVLTTTVELAELGGTIWSVAGPPLLFLIDILGDAVSWFNSLNPAIQKGAIAAAIAIPVLGALAGVIAGVAAAAAAAGGVMALLAGILLSPVVIIGALIGVLVAVIEYFDLWGELIAGLQVTWNALVGALAWGANLIAGYFETIADIWVGVANTIIKGWNALPFVGDVQTIDFDLNIPKTDLSGMKTDVTGKLGGMSAGQGKRAAKDGKRGGRGGGPAPGGGGYGGYGAGGYGGGRGGRGGRRGGDTYQQEVHYHDHGESQNEARQKRIVRGIVSQMNEERRKGQSGLN